MTTVEITESERGQIVRLPEEFRISAPAVSIRRQGDGIILEPVKSATWPEGFFEAIAIDDPTFVRPEQGTVPPVPPLE